ncbi:MAG: hypothetical protein H7A25_18495 [Leptospiraceae bacterium]|nr:hypothetical protein [Leptospiraceae bacterium]MCP5501897.1 hypothetical protein [Leptospiraceae bacterium]
MSPEYIKTPGVSWSINWNWDKGFKRILDNALSSLNVKTVHVNSLYRTTNANSNHQAGKAIDIDRVILKNGNVIDFHIRDSLYNKTREKDFTKKLIEKMKGYDSAVYSPSWLYKKGVTNRVNLQRSDVKLENEHTTHLHIGVTDTYRIIIRKAGSGFIPFILLVGGIYYYAKNKA